MWREFEFCFIVLLRAIVPKYTIKELMENWSEIRKGLMESSRKRKPQMLLISQYL